MYAIAYRMEAIFRGWLSFPKVAFIIFLQIVTSNPFLSFFFRWSHQAIVYTQADKAMVLYSAVLMTFLSSAFFFEASLDVDNNGESETTNVGDALWETFISALISTIFMLPFQHMIPRMIENVNSFTTSSYRPVSLIRRQLDILKRRFCACNDRNSVKLMKHKQFDVVRVWKQRLQEQNQMLFQTSSSWKRPLHSAEQTAQSILFEATDKKSGTSIESYTADPKTNTSKYVKSTLHFLHWKVVVPSGKRQFKVTKEEIEQLNELSSEIEISTVGQLACIKFQNHVKKYYFQREQIRNMEFDAWSFDTVKERNILLGLSIGVLAILVIFTLILCIILSGAFTNEECLLWAGHVGKSIVMQV